MKYKWQLKEHNISKDFLEVAFNSEIIAKMLLNRGIDTIKKAKEYLYPEEYIPSKYEEISGLIKAKDRIIQAIKNNEKITIFGDYDVDGTTATACLILTLKQFTNNIDFYIPNRLSEGYGLNTEAVRTIAVGASGTVGASGRKPLLITCDCGITNVKEVELANELGMDVIITDHHSLPEILPPAYAILNPKQLPEGHKLHFLPGVGVAYKLAEAILEEYNVSTHTDLLDLVTLGMIADLAPLVDENRYLVQIGLPRLAHTKKLGLRELLRVCGLQANGQTGINAEHIGFGIAPRINAVGRLTDANLAVKLMITDDLLEAVHLATELEVQNRERQSLCDETLKDVIALVNEQVDFEKDKCIILAKEGWHHGVIGIIASRIVEKFSLPTLLICIDKEENIARGSGRSIGALNIVETLNECSTFLQRYGGHKAACGLSIKPENIDAFIGAFKESTSRVLADCDISPILNVDAEIALSEINLDLIEKINKLSPFGFGNKMPIFKSQDVEVIDSKSIGKNGQHLKLTLNADYRDLSQQSPIEALAWNHDKNTFSIGEKINTAFTPKINSFNGRMSIQLEIKDHEKLEQKIECTSKKIRVYDYRGQSSECIGLFSVGELPIIFFAESSQKDFLPLKTNTRSNVKNCTNLVLLDLLPDENTFLELINKTNPENVYLAYSFDNLTISSHFLIKRLIGMLRYVVNNKNSRTSEIQLQAALGVNRSTLAYALEILKKIGFLQVEKSDDMLNVTINVAYRQNFEDLIEYNLLLSELKKIEKFHLSMLDSEVVDIEKIINKVFIKEKEFANVRIN